MRWLKNKTAAICFVGIQLCNCGFANDSPSQELLNWQKKYPGNSLVSIAKNLEITINVVNNALEINQDYYREMIVLAENSAFLADSKEYFNDHYDLKKFEAYSLVPELKQYKKIPVARFTKTVEIDDYIFYDDQVVYNFTFPAVGKGTKLVTRSNATTSYAYVPVVFDFGSSIPNENVSVSFSCPRNVSIIYHLFGKDTTIIKHQKTEKGDRIYYTWQATNPKVYEIDDKAPDSRYIIPHLIIQIAGYSIDKEKKDILGSLTDLYAYNYSHISNLSVEISPEVKGMSDSLTVNCCSDKEKVRKIFDWVQKHIKYVAIEDGENGLVPSEAALVLKRRYGDCKGKTSLLVAMIRSAGLKASFAWVGSRERPYRYSEFPSVVNDDHMIAVWWDGEHPVILDGTTFSHQMEDIPSFIQGKECMIEKGKDDFMLYTIPVASAQKNTINDSLFIQLIGDSIIGNGMVTYYGENKADMIRLFEGKDTSLYVRILQNHLPKASNKHLIKSVSISDIQNIEEPFTVSYTFILPDFITRANNNTYVSLNLDRFLQQIVLAEDRDIPVEAEMTMVYEFYCRMLIPEGFRITKLPDSTAYSNASFGFREKYTQGEEHVDVQSNITLDFLVIDGAEMKAFREMLSMINRNYLKSLSLAKTETL